MQTGDVEKSLTVAVRYGNIDTIWIDPYRVTSKISLNGQMGGVAVYFSAVRHNVKQIEIRPIMAAIFITLRHILM